MTFRAYLEISHTDQTIKTYEYVIDRYLNVRPKAQKANYKQVLEYIATFQIRSYASLAALKKYYDYLIEIGVRDDHPCKNIVIKHAKNGVQFQDLLTVDELELLLKRENRYKGVKYRNKCIISFLIFQGLTPANITNLRLKDIDLEDQSVYIKQTPKIRRRIMRLNDRQVQWLALYLRRERPKLEYGDKANLFLTQNGKLFNTDSLNRMIKPLKALIPDKNVHPLSIRQSVISIWLNEQSMPIEQVQTLSGQKWLSSTEKYKRKDMHKQVELINQYFPNVG